MDGHMEKGKFHPHGTSSNKIHSSSINSDMTTSINNDKEKKSLIIDKQLTKDDLSKLSDKDLVKKIKNGSKIYNDWYRSEKNEELYAEIERRNKAIPVPNVSYPKIFRDDDDAVPKMKQKIESVEKEQAYWKKIIKFPARESQNLNQLGDAKWYQMGLVNTKLREAKNKLAGIERQQASGTTLTRKPTYKGGRKSFYYEEN